MPRGARGGGVRAREMADAAGRRRPAPRGGSGRGLLHGGAAVQYGGELRAEERGGGRAGVREEEARASGTRGSAGPEAARRPRLLGCGRQRAAGGLARAGEGKEAQGERKKEGRERAAAQLGKREKEKRKGGKGKRRRGEKGKEIPRRISENFQTSELNPKD